jgi:hypothetical protein
MAVAGVLSAKVSVVSVPEASGSIEVLTRSGYSVRVRKHFEATALLRLLTDPRRRLMLLPSNMPIYCATTPVDLRGSFDGLAAAAKESLGQDARREEFPLRSRHSRRRWRSRLCCGGKLA